MPDLRVEMVTPSLHMGGMERLVVRMAQAFRERGVDTGITVIEALGGLAEEARDLGIPVTLVPTPGVWTNVRARALREHFRMRRPQVVHAHSGVWLKSVGAARTARVPGVVHTFHGTVQNERWHIDLMRRAASWSTDHIVAVSDDLRTLLIERVGIPAHRVRVIINGVDVHRFTPGESRGNGPCPGKDPASLVIGHVARLDPIKNQSMLLRAFELVRRQVPGARLVMAGEGPARGALERLAHELGLAGSVEFLGEVRDTATLYRGFDVFALSSVSEGTSMSILEAMASGVPVVATAVGGTPALVRHGELGVLVPEGDSGAMAEAIVRLAFDPEHRRSLGASARAFTVANLSEDAMLDQYLQLYRQHANGASR
jgi:sugar transferase (PEP-CTERM/EpsH1 system associated)